MAISNGSSFRALGWFFREDPQDKLPLFIGMERRRNNAVVAWRQLEPGADLPQVNEGLGSPYGPVVPEEICVQWPREGLWVPQVVHGISCKDKIVRILRSEQD